MKKQRATNSTPIVIRGESPKAEFTIDTLSVTVSAFSILKKLGCSKIAECVPTDFAMEVFEAFPVLKCLKAERMRSGKNNFANACEFSNGFGFIAFGGNNTKYTPDGPVALTERYQVFITGAGCERLAQNDPQWLERFHALLEKQDDARITRVDVACDFHNGEYSVDHAHDLYKSGAFITRGAPPKGLLIDDLGTGEGRTLYVGKRANGKLLRVYEKGKQLGDKLSKWVRWELELTSKDRVIPFEILLKPQSYIAGAYPATAFMSSVALVIKTAIKKAAITVQHLTHYAKTAYGSLIHFLCEQGETPESIVNTIRNYTYPRRLVAYS